MARTSRGGGARLGTALGGLVVTAALAGGAVLLVSGANAPASGANASSGSTADRVVVCESGTVNAGGVETSSAVAVRLPAGAPLPPGCREA